jgi:hypothetical protein
MRDAQELISLIFLIKYLFLNYENYVLLRVILLLLTLFFHKASVHFNGRIEIPINHYPSNVVNIVSF